MASSSLMKTEKEKGEALDWSETEESIQACVQWIV